MNWTAKFKYGDEEFSSTTSGSMDSGFRLDSEVDSPLYDFGIKINHDGDFSKFSNVVEGTWNDKSFKLVTDSDLDNFKMSQTLEATGYETMSWSSEETFTDSSFTSDWSMSYGAKKVEMRMNGDVEWKKYKAVLSSSVSVKTPFAGFEDNKMDTTLEYSSRLFNLVVEGHKGSPTNTKKFELYQMTTKTGVTAYMKTTLFGDSESVMSLEATKSDGKFTMAAVNDLQFHQASRLSADVEINMRETSSGHSHSGSIEVTCGKGPKKLVWNAGSDSYMCETGFTYTQFGQEMMSYSHKTTWNTKYTKLSQDMTFKSSFDGFKDCEHKMEYDFTQAKKTMSMSMYNDPQSVYDIKAEYDDSMDMMVEFSTPIEAARQAKLQVSSNMASQPWNFKVDGKLNEQTFTSEGHMEINREGIFDVGMTFTSQMPMFEDLQFSLRNTKLNEQYKPHVVIQWASNKKIEMSGTLSWASTYKISVDLNTPFECCRSVVTDVTVNANLPDSMSISFEHKTNKMSKKMTGQMTFNKASTSLSITAETPFDVLSSFELTAALKPRITLLIKKNGETIFNLNGNGRFDSWASHNMEFTVNYPFWNKYMHLKVNNDLSLQGDNSLVTDVQFDYMRGKQITFKYTLSTSPKTSMHMTFTSPFEKFESVKYSLTYEGTVDNWKENTEFEFYYGKVTTATSFSMANGITYHQVVSGQMKNGAEDFDLRKDFTFTGDKNQFELEASMGGSFIPTMSFSTNWTYNPTKLSLKAVLNEYHVEYNHVGQWKDFTCNYLVKLPQSSLWYGDFTNEWKGNWAFKYTDKVSFTATLSCPHHDVDFTLDLGMMNGRFDGTWKYDEQTAKWSNSYSREESPFKYEGSSKFEIPNAKFETGVTVTKDSLSVSNKWDDDEVFGVYVKNPLTSDMEYKPEIKVIIIGDTYEFDGLYKNEGEGLVRDFKLHMTGPKGQPESVRMEFEFQTQSAQLVPGDMKFLMSHTPKDREENIFMDMTTTWGNDRAVVTFNAPHPMKYSIDFSVDTKGQSAEINANWDTKADDKKFNMKFVNKFASHSQRLKSFIDIDVVYMGVSRGFTSNLDWKTDIFTHRLTFDYNGKEIGYDWNVNHESGCVASIELISEWRSMKGSWSNQSLSDGRELSFGFYWDSARDTSKKFAGVSKWEKTGQNTYKWTTTFSHPALSKDLVLTDMITYDTSRYVFSWSKMISFSTDSSKDITVSTALEKNGKWGVELKQDFNQIDIKIGSEFSQNGSKGHFTYKATDGRTKNFSFLTRYDPSSKVLLIQVITPMKTVKLTTETTRSTCTVNLQLDRETYQTAVTYRQEDSYMLVKLSCPHNEYKFECSAISNGYQMKLSKTKDGNTTTEALVAASMDENRTVNGKLYWNPTLYSELKSKIASVQMETNELMKRMAKAGTKEANKKVKSLQLGSDFDNIMPRSEAEMQTMQQDMELAKQMIGAAYDQDVFFMKSIGESAIVVVEALQEEFAVVNEKMIRFYEEVIMPHLSSLDAEKFREELVLKLARIEERINNLKTTMTERWADEAEKIAQAMERVAEFMKEVIDKVSTYAAEHPAMETLKKIHAVTMDKFNQMSDAAYNQIGEVADPQMYANAIYATHEYVSETLVNSRLTELISADTLNSLSDSLMYKMQFYYQYYDVADNMKMFIEHSRNIAADYLNDYLSHYVDEALNGFEWKQYDLENGRIEFEMSIPTRYTQVNFTRVKTDLKQRIDSLLKHMAKYHFNLKEMFYMYKPQSFGQILPPYNAQAIIAGQHIRTFDRRHYDFSSGSCSYLLARDFQDGNFTVFVNYNGLEQSLTVHSNGMTIDIAQDNSVKLDGSKIELPIQHFNTSVVRKGHNVVVSSTLGVEVVCDNDHGLCTVEMSGFYFAKTGGLFGTYNNEPSDDFTTSDNQNVTDVKDFANSWTHRCSGRNTAQQFNQVKGTKEYKACAAVFKDSSSSLQPCFAVVDPMQAFHKCVNDMSLNVILTDKNGPCKAAKFYETECRFAGVTVDQPAQCVMCEMDHTSISMSDDTYRMSDSVMAADVVFVVEEKMCNYNTDDKLPALSKYIDSALSRNQFRDIRYGLVGFGGEGVHEPSHVHTMDSKMFAKQSEFKLGTSALQFADGENRDVFEAIDFAAQYPFRSGATKLIIVIPCSDCSTSSMSTRSLSSRLVGQDITLHVINDFSYEVTVEGKNPENNYIFGIDNTAVYSLRDSSRVRGNTNIYSITTKPTDYCSNMALQTGGTVFDLNMMTKMRGSTAKNFQKVFAQTIAKTTYPSTCTTCSCEYNQVFNMARSVCKKC